MWSNLYKQYNVSEKQDGIRVIDSNEMVQEKLTELARKLKAEAVLEGQEFADGFVGGITAQSVEKVLQNPKELLLEAQEESDQIMQEARKKAGIVLAEAQVKSQEILKKAKQDGYQQGYETGSKDVLEKLNQEFQEKEQSLEQRKRDLQEDYELQLADLEPRLLEVIIQVVEKVFHLQFDDKSDILLYLIQKAILNIENSRNFHVRVGDEQRLFLEKHKDEILERVGHDISLDILSDPLLEGNQCVIETEAGVFDCSLGVQLENLIKDLRSLSS